MGYGTKSHGLMTEEELLRSLSPLDDVPNLGATTVPKAKRGEQQRENAMTGLSVLPVIGNAISAYDATQTGGAAYDAFAAGDTKGGAINAGLTGLNAVGALLGLPVGKTAKAAAKSGKDSVNVFVPAVDDAATDRARDMRASGKTNAEVWKDTGRIFGAEGTPREVLSDSAMKIDTSKIRRGYDVPLGDVVQHPELFDYMPSLRSQKITQAGAKPDGEPLRTARTNLQGVMELPLTNKANNDLAKLLQYKIADDAGLPPAMRHDVGGMRRDLADTASKAASARYETPQDLEAVAAYLNKITGLRGALDQSEGSKFGSSLVTSRSSGNVDAKHASQLAPFTADELRAAYPYTRNRQKGGVDRPAAFENLLPLLRPDATPEQVQATLRNWYQFGSGKDRTSEDLRELIARLK